MGLIKCQDCNIEFSDRAPACPRCGGPSANFDNGQAAVGQVRNELNAKIDRERRVRRRSGVQNAGCLFMVLGIAFSLVLLPVGVFFLALGLILVIVGLLFVW